MYLPISICLLIVVCACVCVCLRFIFLKEKTVVITYCDYYTQYYHKLSYRCNCCCCFHREAYSMFV